MASAPRILVVSDDAVWREALTLALQDSGAEVAEDDSAPLSGALVEALRSAGAGETGDGTARLDGIVGALRKRRAGLPIVIMSSVPIDAYSRYEGADANTRVVLADSVRARLLAERVLHEVAEMAAASAQGRGASPAGSPVGQARLDTQTATIEITISEATLRCDVRIGALSDQWGPSSWTSRPELLNINDEYSIFEQSGQISVLNQMLIEIVGKRLLLHLFREPIQFAKAFIEKSMPDGCPINYRFVLQDGDLEYVPFELVATENKGEYLRYYYPLSRKLVPRETHRSADRMFSGDKARQKVLFILSDVRGSFEVRGEKFKGKEIFSLRPLPQLQTELETVTRLYGAENVRVLELLPRQDNFSLIEDAFSEAAFDIVHFAGHSVRADVSGKVFLVLPQTADGDTVPCDVEHFASLAAENDVRLVILSSCEGTSGRALSRMASNGVPAIVGFRWEVEDRDAAFFTPAFHEELRKGGRPVPVSIAFHRALRRLKAQTPERLAWFSPILMIQHSEWHKFAVEV